MSDSIHQHTCDDDEPPETEVVRDRRVMARSGLCVLANLYRGAGDRSRDSLTIETRGMTDVPEIAQSLKGYCNGAVSGFFIENGQVGGLERYPGDAATRFLKDRWGLRPLVLPIVAVRE